MTEEQKQDEFANIGEDTKQKYIEIGILFFVKNWSYKNLEDNKYGSPPTIATALRYFRKYFDNPDSDTSLCGAIESIKDRIKALKVDLDRLRKKAEGEPDGDAERGYYTRVTALSAQISKDEELLFKLQGILRERAPMEIPEDVSEINIRLVGREYPKENETNS